MKMLDGYTITIYIYIYHPESSPKVSSSKRNYFYEWFFKFWKIISFWVFYRKWMSFIQYAAENGVRIDFIQNIHILDCGNWLRFLEITRKRFRNSMGTEETIPINDSLNLENLLVSEFSKDNKCISKWWAIRKTSIVHFHTCI